MINNKDKDKDWQEKEVVDAPEGHIFKDWVEENGIHCLITKGRLALCAFVGISESHPLAGFHPGFGPFHCSHLPLRVRGGEFVFGGRGYQKFPEKNCWYGWDYLCHDDISTRWTVEMVEKEVKEVACDFKKLAIFAEKLIIKHQKYLIEKINDELVSYLHKKSEYHNKNLEHDAKDAYNEVYRKILEIQDKLITSSAMEFDEINAKFEF